ncbi:hypothetical protein [Caenispirillum bisanense]|uniref:hypothetical protein n=1 Tax=Caenispirillum bisanense TaxID=414052 RepID=UPI0031D3AEBF
MEKRPMPGGREQVRETPTEARQARKGFPVAMVLAGGLTLGIIALIGLMIWASSGEPEPTPQEQRQGWIAPAPANPPLPLA